MGPPGSGKSTYAQEIQSEYTYINQDTQGKKYLDLFLKAIDNRENIVVDRMNFNVSQRKRFIEPALLAAYTIKIVEFLVPRDICYSRILLRKDHPTIKNEENASNALDTYFNNYEAPSYQEGELFIQEELHKASYNKQPAIIVDIDGTLANCDHRIHHIQKDKKDWVSFFGGMKDDTLNQWCKDIISGYANTDINVILLTGRPEKYRPITREWLAENRVYWDSLYMRPDKNNRPDYEYKRMIYNYELKPYYDVMFVIEDRSQVVKMWRELGLTCLQCNEGDY